MRKKGFTLVELAIVLVIIGTLITGVLVAESMITTSRINAQVRQIQQLDAAISNFQTKYNSLPGDSTVMPDPGDGNGKIDSTTDVPSFSGESRFVFKHLQQGVNVFPEYAFDTTDMHTVSALPLDFVPPTVNAIPAKINNKTGIIIGYDGPGWYNMGNVYGIASLEWANLEETSGSLEKNEALAIDKKIDDGVFNTGVFFAREYSDNYIIQIKILTQLGQQE